MKASAAQLQAALDRPSADLRLFLLHGPDEAGALALAARLGRGLGPDAERVDLDPGTLRSDPARLADEAASRSLFGGRRWIRVTGAGEECVPAVELLLAAPAGDPAVVIAPSAKATGKLVKAALAAGNAMSFACYPPEGNNAEALVTALAREYGLRLGRGVAARIAYGADNDRAVMAQEVDKLALFLDAAPDRPADADLDAVAAIGAEIGEGEIGDIVDATLAGEPGALAAALARMEGTGGSPIPWLRALARRLADLSAMRAAVDAGELAGDVFRRFNVFWRDQPATSTALARWSGAALMRAHATVRRAERESIAAGGAGRTVADQALLALAAGRRR